MLIENASRCPICQRLPTLGDEFTFKEIGGGWGPYHGKTLNIACDCFGFQYTFPHHVLNSWPNKHNRDAALAVLLPQWEECVVAMGDPGSEFYKALMANRLAVAMEREAKQRESDKDIDKPWLEMSKEQEAKLRAEGKW